MSESNSWDPEEAWSLVTGVQPGDTVKLGLMSGEELTGRFLNFIFCGESPEPFGLSVQPRYTNTGEKMTVPWHAVSFLFSTDRPKQGTVDTFRASNLQDNEEDDSAG